MIYYDLHYTQKYTLALTSCNQNAAGNILPQLFKYYNPNTLRNEDENMMKCLTSQALLFSSCFLYGPHAFNKLADFVYLHGLSY